jgi:hypothetical protein
MTILNVRLYDHIDAYNKNSAYPEDLILLNA